MPETPVYLMWQDLRPKVDLRTKIAEACQAYRDRFGVEARAAIVHPDDIPTPFNAADYPVVISLRLQVGRNTVWIGQGDA